MRNILSVCCLSETVAVTLIGAERLAMPEGSLKTLLTRIYADEIGHARFGWRLASQHIPSLEPEVKARLSAYLRVAFAALEKHELAHLPIDFRPPAEGAALGLCSGKDGRELFLDTVAEVIIPRLEALGLSARIAWDSRKSATPPGPKPRDS
jgi:hypothetical protein